MIKKEYKLVPILGSKKELTSHILIQKKDTHQYGMVHPSSLRGKQARRNLRDHFDPVSLYVVDLHGIVEDNELSIITLKDNSKILGKPNDFLEETVVSKDKISIFQRDLFNCWVAFVDSERSSRMKFRLLSPKVLQSLLEAGGRVWIEMEEFEPIEPNDSQPPYVRRKLQEGHPIIHIRG